MTSNRFNNARGLYRQRKPCKKKKPILAPLQAMPNFFKVWFTAYQPRHIPPPDSTGSGWMPTVGGVFAENHFNAPPFTQIEFQIALDVASQLVDVSSTLFNGLGHNTEFFHYLVQYVWGLPFYVPWQTPATNPLEDSIQFAITWGPNPGAPPPVE